MASFTDEEGYGKYLDLNESYQKYVNLKGIEVNKLNHNVYKNFITCAARCSGVSEIIDLHFKL